MPSVTQDGTGHLLGPVCKKRRMDDLIDSSSVVAFLVDSHRQILPAVKRARHDDKRPLARPLPSTSFSDSSTLSTTSSISTAPCHVCHRQPRRRCDLGSMADCEGCGQRTCAVCLRTCFGWPSPPASPVPHKIDAEPLPDDPPAENPESGHSPAATDDLPALPPPAHAPPPWPSGGRGHRHRVCSRCCQECGPDGHVVCHGCLSGP